jgi:predicted neuraminidase
LAHDHGPDNTGSKKVSFQFGLASLLVGSLVVGCTSVQREPASAEVGAETAMKSGFIYETASFPSCHASTIEETKAGLVAAWFGGSDEGNADVGIWVSRHDGTGWSAPAEAANGVQEDGKRFPSWNPVLFQPKDGPLLLFYKVGPTPSSWWGMLITSADDGRSWSKPRRLPDGILGPIKNKPVLLADGSLLCPSSSEHAGWRVHMERTSDLGATWKKSEPLNDGKEFGAIQPTVLFHGKNRIQILCRSRQSRITECWSQDGGKSWGSMQATELPNPNSGIDAVTLKDGRHLMVHNPVTKGRSPLVVSLSGDGKSWRKVLTLEDQPGEYSYPAIIQGRDGRVHITYTWKRQRIKHSALNPSKF